jgi:hypothetical protein
MINFARQCKITNGKNCIQIPKAVDLSKDLWSGMPPIRVTRDKESAGLNPLREVPRMIKCTRPLVSWLSCWDWSRYWTFHLV